MNETGNDAGSVTGGLPIGCSPDALRAEALAAPSHVYFVYSAGRVKIGFSTNWATRVDAVCQGCGHAADLILVMPGDRQMEAGYHALFDEYREVGEWFRCEGKVKEFLERFASPDGQEVLQLAHGAFTGEAI